MPKVYKWENYWINWAAEPPKETPIFIHFRHSWGLLRNWVSGESFFCKMTLIIGIFICVTFFHIPYSCTSLTFCRKKDAFYLFTGLQKPIFIICIRQLRYFTCDVFLSLRLYPQKLFLWLDFTLIFWLCCYSLCLCCSGEGKFSLCASVFNQAAANHPLFLFLWNLLVKPSSDAFKPHFWKCCESDL